MTCHIMLHSPQILLHFAHFVPSLPIARQQQSFPSLDLNRKPTLDVLLQAFRTLPQEFLFSMCGKWVAFLAWAGNA